MHRKIQMITVQRVILGVVTFWLFLAPRWSYSQNPPSVMWSEFYTNQNDNAFDFAQKENGHIVVAGHTTNWITMESQIMLFETDGNGNEIWRKYIGEADTIARQILPQDDGGYFLCGSTTSPIYGAHIVRVDSLGGVEWTRNLDDIEAATRGFAITSSGDLAVGIRIRNIDVSPHTSTAGIVFLSSAGDSLDTRTFESEGYVVPRTLAAAPINGGLVLGGFHRKSVPSNDEAYLLKVDELGNREWSVAFDNEDIMWLNDVIEDSEGNFVAVGWSSANGNDLFAFKVSAVGEVLWDLRVGGPDLDHGNAVASDRDGGYVFTGSSSGHLYLVKVSSDGQVVWETISDLPSSRGKAVKLDRNGNYVIIGSSWGSSDPGDALAIKYSSTTVLKKDSLPSNVQDTGNTLHIFPNPASGYVDVAFELKQPTTSRLEIVNVIGQTVRGWSQRMDTAGKLRIDLVDGTGARLPPGVYLIILSGRDYMVSSSFTVIDY